MSGLLKGSKSRFGEVFGRTWDTFFANFWKLFFVAGALLLLQTIVLEILKKVLPQTPGTVLANIGVFVVLAVSLLLSGLLVAGVYRVAYAIHEGSSINFMDGIKSAFSKFLKYTLMLLRLVWYVIWPILVVMVVMGISYYLLATPGNEASAQAPSTEATSVATDEASLDELEAMFGPSATYDSTMGPLALISSVKGFLASNKMLVIIFTLGILASIALTIWRSVKATFSIAILTEKNCGVNEALATSIDTVKGNWWKVFGNVFFFWVSTVGLYFLFAIGTAFAVGLLMGLFSLVKLNAVNIYLFNLIPLVAGSVSGSLAALFHITLYKKL